MTSDVHALYREVIIDHNKPPEFHTLEAGHKSEGLNPLCGDRLAVYVQVENEVIRDVSFDGLGCAIAKAPASLMTESVKGKTVVEAERAMRPRTADVTASPDAPVDDLGALSALAGVRRFPFE